MAILSWQDTFDLAKSQGLDDNMATQSANNWQAKGGKMVADIPVAAPSTVKITTPGGQASTGYASGGLTYADPGLTQRVGAGTIVNTAGGQYIMGNDGKGMVYDPNKYAPVKNADGTYSVGYMSNNQTYTDPGLTQRVTAGTTVYGADGKPYVMGGAPVQVQAQNPVVNPVVTPVPTQAIQTDNANTGSPFEGIWGQYMDWANSKLVAPSAEAPNLENISSIVAGQLQPLHDVQEASLQRGLDANQKKLSENMAARGIYNSSSADNKASELVAGYGDSMATLDATFLAQVSQTSTNVYNQELASLTNSQSSYNNAIMNIGLSAVNGMINQQQFIMDDAYRNAVLGQAVGKDVLDNIGTVGPSTGSTTTTPPSNVPSTYTWQETYQLAKSQGLDDNMATQSANNWAAKGGKPR